MGCEQLLGPHARLSSQKTGKMMVWASRAGLAQGQRGFWSIRSGEGAGQGTGRQGKKRTPGVVVKEFGVLEGQGMPAAWALPVWGWGMLGFSLERWTYLGVGGEIEEEPPSWKT